MSTKENAHLLIPTNLLYINSLANINSTVLDTLFYEATSVLIALGSGNLSATRTVTFSLQESDISSGPFTNVDTLFTEWFLDGVPGGPMGSPGAQTWQRSVPGQGGPLTMSTEIATRAHVFTVSYIGGLKRYLQLNVGISISANNELVVVGVGFPKETAVPAYRTYPDAADFPSIAFP